jgi:hypothetical protein
MFARHPHIAKRMADEAKTRGLPVVREAANRKISPRRRAKTTAERTIDALRRLG